MTTINYTVKAGDTLAAIAQRFYGDPSRYREIAAASRINNPNLILVGQRLTIPNVPDLSEVAVTAQRIPALTIMNPLARQVNGEPLPGVYPLEEISGSAPRDYTPAIIAAAIALYFLMSDSKRRA